MADEMVSEEKKINPWLITSAVMLATFVSALNTSIANVALKQIGGSFSATQDESLWIVTSYLVASSVMLPATAWFSSVLGRKKFFISCLVLFTLASILCGIAPNMTVMILGRILQGLGGGVLFPLSQAILFETFPKEKYGLAMAIFGIGVVFAPILGPVLGGWLTTNYSWNWIFFISVPFGIVALSMIVAFIKDPPYMQAQGIQKIDYWGFILLVVWLASFQVMLDNGQKMGWFGSLRICELGLLALISFGALIYWELVNKKPLFDLKIFKNWNFSIGTIIYTIIFAIMYGTMAVLPLFLQSLMGYTSWLSGLAATPMGIGSFIGIVVTGIFADRVDLRKFCAFGLLFIAVSAYLFGSLNLNISLINVVVPNIVLGVGLSISITGLTTLIFANVNNEEMTNASGLQNLLKNVGGAVGTSFVGVMVSRFSQIRQHYLVDNLSQLNPVFQQKVHALTVAFSQSASSVVAQQKANYLIYSNMIKQSYLCAYMDSYRTYALIIIIILPFLFILKKINNKKED